jgi:SPP1 gp7 family putative phage head morphogenesis protein
VITHDLRLKRRETVKQRAAFAKVRRAEMSYARKLRKVARHVGELVRAFKPGSPEHMADLQDALLRYSAMLTPWARATAAKMLEEVARRDEAAWFEYSNQMGYALRQEIRRAPTGQVMREMMQQQVTLITSLPLEAAERVHKLTIEGIVDGTRAKEVAAEIMKTGQVTQSRANLIARTEVGRTSTSLTAARASYVGSEGYVWRTSKDADVRPSHKKMEGQFVDWNDPPTLDGLTGHAGALPNCRCYPEPVLPDE